MKRIFNHPQAPATGRKYWRSLEEFAGTPEFRARLEREFPQGAAELQGDEVTRRGFMQFMGASLANDTAAPHSVPIMAIPERQSSGSKRVNMSCETCHHGRPRPTTLGEELGERYEAKGIQAALDYYTDLKKKFYGQGGLDFGENSLNQFGYDLLEKKDAAGAVKVFKRNAEEFPQSGNVWDSLAEGFMKAGDLKQAEENYKKSLTLDPANDNAKQMLKKIKESTEK